MKASFLFFVCLGLLSLNSPVQGQEFPEATAQHKVLEKDLGDWVGTMKIYVGGPDADPITMPVKESSRMLDGGMWLLTEFEAGPFKGRGQYGYDTNKKKYVGTWIDNSSPGLTVAEGQYNEDTDELIMFQKGLDPMTGELQDMKSVGTKLKNGDRRFVMYTKNNDDWVKSFEIDYQPAK